MKRRRCGMAFGVCAAAVAGVIASVAAGPEAGNRPAPLPPADAKARLAAELKKLPYRIVHETFRDDNWELFMMHADGSGAVNLTRTPSRHELYPHASPDGSKISFVADEGAGRAKSRNVYYMNADGTGRKLVATNARQPFWRPDGKALAYLQGEFDRFSMNDFATKGLFLYDLATGRATQHPNHSLHHLYNPGFSPDGQWLLATVHGGMGHRHANLAIQGHGQGVFQLKPVRGCRPDISPDGKHLVWNATDQLIAVAHLDLTGSVPKVSNVRKLLTCPKTHEMYHADWSPDGRFVAFAHGPKAGEQVGEVAKGWNICVADASATNVWVCLTADGRSNKEPDWVPAPTKRRP